MKEEIWEFRTAITLTALRTALDPQALADAACRLLAKAILAKAAEIRNEEPQ